MDKATLRRTLTQSFLLLGGWFSLGHENYVVRYGLGTPFFAISLCYSLRFLLESTSLFSRFLARFRKKY